MKNITKTMATNNDIPNYHVSFAVRDAWRAIPPCTYEEHPYCHVDCPNFYECYPEGDDVDDWEREANEQWGRA